MVHTRLSSRKLATSCATCFAWEQLPSRLCAACYSFGQNHELGECAGCRRNVPLKKGYCRLCWCQASLEGRLVPHLHQPHGPLSCEYPRPLPFSGAGWLVRDEPRTARRAGDHGLWLQCACTVLVASGAAYASYRHGLVFALRFGADPTTAAIWPLIVDGLLTTATVELWRPGGGGGRWRAWLAFLFGVALSLCANIASAPELQ